MIIGVSDIDNFTFSRQLIDHWQGQGHTVLTSLYHEETFVDKCDVIFYDYASVNMVELNKFHRRPRRAIIRGIDIELYQNYYQNFDWDLIDYFVFISEPTKQMVLDKGNFDCPPNKIKVIPPGVNTDRFTLKNATRGKKAVFCGRLWIGKNAVGAIDVVHELNKLDPGWSLYLRGDSADPPWWRQYLNYRIEQEDFHIYIDGRQDDINAYYEDKDLLILPSFKEAFSYVAAECLAKGIPVLINNWYGAKQIWPPEFVYSTPREAASIYCQNLINYAPMDLRRFILDKYDEKIMFQQFDLMLEGKL
jgi:glycosyltransferase involved in cell wall biosynthesis